MDNIICLKRIVEKEMAVENQIPLLFINLTKHMIMFESQNYGIYWIKDN